MKPDYEKIITNSFPKNMKSNVSKVISIIPLESKYSIDLISSNSYSININGEILNIPAKNYFNEHK